MQTGLRGTATYVGGALTPRLTALATNFPTTTGYLSRFGTAATAVPKGVQQYVGGIGSALAQKPGVSFVVANQGNIFRGILGGGMLPAAYEGIYAESVQNSDGTTSYISPIEKNLGLSPTAFAVLSTAWKPSRGVLAAYGNFKTLVSSPGQYFSGENSVLADKMASMNLRGDVSLLNSIDGVAGDYGGGALAFLYGATDSFLQAATGSYSVRAATNLPHTAKDIFSFGQSIQEMLAGQGQAPDQSARGVEYGMVLGKIFGAGQGFQSIAKRTRVNTGVAGKTLTTFKGQKPALITDVGRYGQFMGVSKMSRGSINTKNIVSDIHSSAAGLVKVNAAISLGAGAISSGQNMSLETLGKQVRVLAYDMDNVATGAVAMAGTFKALGGVVGLASRSKTLNSLSSISPVKSAVLAVGGTGAYSLGTLDSTKDLIGGTFSNYVALAGLAAAGIGGRSLVKGLQKSGSYMNFIKKGEIGHKLSSKVSNGTLTAGFAGAGIAGGEIYYQNYLSEGGTGSIRNRVTALGLGALSGLAARNAPALGRLTTRAVVTSGEIASLAATGYAVKKGIFDPSVAGIEYWLNDSKHFDFEEATRPHLFSSTEIQRYETVDGETLDHLRSSSPDHVTFAELKGRKGVLVELATGRIKNKETGKYELVTKTAGSDLIYAAGIGAVLYGVNRVATKSAQAYKGGEAAGLTEATGMGRGAWTGWKDSLARGTEVKIPFKSDPVKLRSFAGKNPTIASGIVLGSGVVLNEIATSDNPYYGLKETGIFGDALRYSSYGMMVAGGVGLASRAAGHGMMTAGRTGSALRVAGEKSSAFSGRIAGNALAAQKTVLWDLGIRGTGTNILMVMAPLQGIIEGTSILTQKYIEPSAYTGFEKAAWNRTFGAFWNEDSAVKFQDLGGSKAWDNASAFEKIVLSSQYAERSYFSGLFGTYEDGPNKGASRIGGFSDLANAFGGEAGRNGEAGNGIARVLSTVDETNVYFAGSLALLSPLAGKALSNIKHKNRGMKFQALAKGMDELTGVFGTGSTPKTASPVSQGFNRFGNMAVNGTIEEAVTENVIQQGLNLIPGLSPGAAEVIQEIISPNRVRMSSSTPNQGQALRYVNKRLASIESRINALQEKGINAPRAARTAQVQLAKAQSILTGDQVTINQYQTEFNNLDAQMKEYKNTGVTPSSIFKREHTIAKTNLEGAVALANGTGFYDDKAVLVGLMPVMQMKADTLKGDARKTIMSMVNTGERTVASDARIVLVPKGTLSNAQTNADTTAQVLTDRNGEKYVAVDVSGQWDFDLGVGGTGRITSNATGIYNAGAGGHEFIHLLVDEVRADPVQIARFESKMAFKISVGLESSGRYFWRYT